METPKFAENTWIFRLNFRRNFELFTKNITIGFQLTISQNSEWLPCIFPELVPRIPWYG